MMYTNTISYRIFLFTVIAIFLACSCEEEDPYENEIAIKVKNELTNDNGDTYDIQILGISQYDSENYPDTINSSHDIVSYGKTSDYITVGHGVDTYYSDLWTVRFLYCKTGDSIWLFSTAEAYEIRGLTLVKGGKYEVTVSSAELIDHAEVLEGDRYYNATVYNNNIYLIGGTVYTHSRVSRDYENDVVFSHNGIDWKFLVYKTAQWSGREDIALTTYDNKIWLLGGYKYSTYQSCKNDVWSSTDGINWSCATTDAPWDIRRNASAFTYNKKLWIMGGCKPETYITHYYDDVWNTTDGTNWENIATEVPWANNAPIEAFVFDDKIWVVKSEIASYDNEVWNSTDGIAWTQLTDSIPIVPTKEFECTTFDDKMWLFYVNDSTDQLESHYSTNGSDWNVGSTNIETPESFRIVSFVFDDNLWIIDLNEFTRFKSPDGINWEEVE